MTGFGENPPYGIRARFAQCVFLVAQVEMFQSPDFVTYMSNNPSSNCCRLLRRLAVLYEGEISLHFDSPSRHSRRTRSLLLWAVIRILYLETARFIDLLYVRSPFSFLGIYEQSAVVVNNKLQLLLDLYVHFKRLRPGPFNWFFRVTVVCRNAIRVYSNAFSSTVISWLLGVWRHRKQSAVSPQPSIQSA